MNYHKIDYDNMLNGEGLRVVLYVSGCTHCCEDCQNPQTWDTNSGKLFDETVYNKIMDYLSKDYIDGITFSGGDPLHKNNLKEIYNLCKDIKSKFKNKTIWLYTGYTYEQIMYLADYFEWDDTLKINACRKEIVTNYVDVLVDGKYDKDRRSQEYPWAGSTNQRIIDIKKTNTTGNIVIYKSNIE